MTTCTLNISLQYPFLMMHEKLVLCLDKRDYNSTVGVMYDPFIGMICYFPKGALLYQVKTVRLNSYNVRNRYQIHDNICIVDAPKLDPLSLCASWSTWFRPLTWCCVGGQRETHAIAWELPLTTKRSKIEYRVMADTSNHILCNMYVKNVKLHSLPIHWYYSYQNTLEL